MKKYILALIGLMFNIMQSQTNNPEYERVYIEIGYLKPLDKLSNKFDISPSFGFWFRNRIQKNDYVDLGFNFFKEKCIFNLRRPSFSYCLLSPIAILF